MLPYLLGALTGFEVQPTGFRDAWLSHLDLPCFLPKRVLAEMVARFRCQLDILLGGKFGSSLSALTDNMVLSLSQGLVM